MAYLNAEHKLSNCIGCFSTVGQVIITGSVLNTSTDTIDYTGGSFLENIIPGQCQVFLTTSKEFVWFVEQRDVIYSTPDSQSGTLPVTFANKKVYPAKVNGLSLPLIKNSFHSNSSVTIRWRDELIRYGSLSAANDLQSGNFRPGFGQLIPSDLQRPLNSVTIQTNNLGLPNLTAQTNIPVLTGLTGPLGRLMSIASYVDPELAAKYDDSKSKKKKKSLNEQTYQENPTYPVYTAYQNNGGY
jgi:hypothetical protein